MPACNLSHKLIAVRMDESELQLRNSLQLLPRRFDLCRAQSRDLDQDMIGTLLGDDRLADTKFVHTFPDDLDRLLLHLRRDWSRFTSLFGDRRHEPDQKRGASLQIEPEMNLLFERQERVDRKNAKQQGQGGAQPTFCTLLVRQESTTRKEAERRARKRRSTSRS